MCLAIAMFALAGCRQIFGLEPPATGDAAQADAPASCSDNQLSPGETDVDCGGICPACGTGASCTQHSDCKTGVCAGTKCLLAKTCLEIRNAGQLTSGIYPIAPNAMTFDAYCDQTTEGGGWTLVMKLSSASLALRFDAPQWTTAATLFEDDLDPNSAPQGRDAKLVAYNEVAGTEMRLRWLDPDHSFAYTPPSATTALGVFMGGEDLVVGKETDQCNGQLLSMSPSFLANGMRHATGHQFYGVNGQDNANGTNSHMRWGFGSNDEQTNPWLPHQGAGTDDTSLTWDSQTDCTECSCYGNEYVPSETSANMWIR
ncbi:MAG TPA: fibrinogen-like YCDxxxxGGGW domain-containing protein [Kofleriaceae bacterium]|nr:fibrinogen-like YCDxxxxGGGW domain-containing protein [Kofleriaceae bacterium]